MAKKDLRPQWRRRGEKKRFYCPKAVLRKEKETRRANAPHAATQAFVRAAVELRNWSTTVSDDRIYAHYFASKNRKSLVVTATPALQHGSRRIETEVGSKLEARNIAKLCGALCWNF